VASIVLSSAIERYIASRVKPVSGGGIDRPTDETASVTRGYYVLLYSATARYSMRYIAHSIVFRESFRIHV